MVGRTVLHWVRSAGDLIYPHLPSVLPVHWGIDGAPDSFNSRFGALLLTPLICLGTAGLLWAIGRFSPPDRSNGPVLRTSRPGLGRRPCW